jgi:hypothetical protein
MIQALKAMAERYGGSQFGTGEGVCYNTVRAFHGHRRLQGW